MAIRNRLTQMLEIEHPVLLAPMDIVSGGKLAAAVSQAGGLGLLGGGYGDDDWIDQEWERAGNARIGCDFITWSLANRPYELERALARRPVAIMLSFGDPRPFARTISALRPFRTVATRPLLLHRFSNRPFKVKRFQTNHHHSSVDVAHGLVLLF
ncbi:MAG: nitronate monooxygenase, partial [Xanthobacteraceae bacterium]